MPAKSKDSGEKNADKREEDLAAVSVQPKDYQIPFNKPFLAGKESEYILEAVKSQQISGGGAFTKKCQQFFEKRYSVPKTLMTSSCTDALEMSALLANIGPSDEVIIPSYTFVSSANAFVLRGARVVFADSEELTPNIDAEKIEELITPKTKALVVVHYGGVACDMDAICEIARKHDLFLIEDSAHAIESFYRDKPLGTIGDLGTFSFHQTKNIICGEGGLLMINDPSLSDRAEIIWEKGTNRAAFFRGMVNKYEWVDIGSSFLPSDLVAAYLYAQLENLERIQKQRIHLYNRYQSGLQHLEQQGVLKLPHVPDYASRNGHLFYIVCESLKERSRLIRFLADRKILAVFHYLPLHASKFYNELHDGRELKNVDKFSDCLLRLPLFFELSDQEQDYVIESVAEFYS